MSSTTRTEKTIRIVILGGGTAGWMTAAALAKLLPSAQYSIKLVESEQIGTVGVGEATLPHLRYFNQRLGIDESAFMRATQATFKLGIEFANWGRKGLAYIHPFGDYGQSLANIGFHHYWLQQRHLGDTTPIDAYSLPVMACRANKFAFPSADPSQLASTYSYAYHIDAGRYAAFLRTFSESHGVQRHEGKVIDVTQLCINEHIESLLMDNGERIEGDFFIDCSGFRGQLIEKVLKSEFEDWSEWLPCNKAIALASERSGPTPPYTKAIAHDAGWQWQIPLQHRMGNGHVFCDGFTSHQAALDTLEQHLPGKAMSEPNLLSFTTGKRKKSWHKNCVAIGLSSGFLEPLESTSIYLIQSAIMKLLELIPSSQQQSIKATEFNRAMDMEMQRIRDFLILHYHATRRDDSEFWRYCKNMSVPDSLAQKIALFKQTGHIAHYQYGLFLEPSWIAVYLGQGLIPDTYDARLDNPNLSISHNMQQWRQAIEDSVAAMPAQDAMLEKLNDDCLDDSSASVRFSLYGARK